MAGHQQMMTAGHIQGTLASHQQMMTAEHFQGTLASHQQVMKADHIQVTLASHQQAMKALKAGNTQVTSAHPQKHHLVTFGQHQQVILIEDLGRWKCSSTLQENFASCKSSSSSSQQHCMPWPICRPGKEAIHVAQETVVSSLMEDLT